MPQTYKEDCLEITNHIHSIFKAFLKQDRETIQRLHTNDWVGFLIQSTTIERGIEAYMVNVEKSLQNFKGIDYELLDTEIQIYGDIALVYYIARYDYAEQNGDTHSLPLRSIDIYRRESNSWIQAGSHITVIPSSDDLGEGNSK